MRWYAVVAAFCLWPIIGACAESSPPPVEVMVVSVFHMSNPGHDLHDAKVDDVLTPQRQSQIATVTDRLAAFHPDKIAVEWPKDLVEERFAKYLAGTLTPSHNEVVQLGFRLAKTAHARGVYGIDVDGDFPYDAVKRYADAHGMAPLLAAQAARGDEDTAEEERVLARQGVAAAIRRLNTPSHLAADNGFYRTVLKIGAGADQPGADLETAWYRRNFLICANLLQIAKPGDRIVIIYGAGHGLLLRQCVAETPGYVLVEPNSFLQR